MSLLVGFVGGRYWMRGYPQVSLFTVSPVSLYVLTCIYLPQLQPQQMMSVVCGGYSGHDSVALCRIPVPRLEHNHQVGREKCD